MKSGEFLALEGKRQLTKHWVYLSALRLPSGELLLLASSQAPESALSRYKLRWEIETLFSCLKGRGFRFESTRLTKKPRIETLFGVLAIAFAWAHKVGDWRDAEQKKIPIKKHGRLAISYFRYGLDWIRQALTGAKDKSLQLKQCLLLLTEAWPDMRFKKRLSSA